MFFIDKSFVLRGPCTLMYSHDRIAKKKAPMNNSQSALSRGEMDS